MKHNWPTPEEILNEIEIKAKKQQAADEEAFRDAVADALTNAERFPVFVVEASLLTKDTALLPQVRAELHALGYVTDFNVEAGLIIDVRPAGIESE